MQGIVQRKFCKSKYSVTLGVIELLPFEDSLFKTLMITHSWFCNGYMYITEYCLMT